MTVEPIHVRAADLHPGDVLVRRGFVVETVSEPRTGAEGRRVVEVGYEEGGSNSWLADSVFEVLRIDFDDVPLDAVREVRAASLRPGDLLWHPHRARVVASVSESVADANGIPSVEITFEGGGSGVWSAARRFRVVRPRRVALAPGRIWEITTEHRTRHLVDLRDGRARRMRLPGVGRPSIPSTASGRGGSGSSIIPGWPRPTTGAAGTRRIVGEPAILLGPDFGDRYVTAPVVAVRALDADEIPPVVGGMVYEPRGY